MKRVLVFIGLKVAEIGGYSAILCLGVWLCTNFASFRFFCKWLTIVVFGGIILLLAAAGFHQWFKANWEWAGKILGK